MYMYYVYEVKVVDSDPKDVYFITFKGYKQTNKQTDIVLLCIIYRHRQVKILR